MACQHAPSSLEVAEALKLPPPPPRPPPPPPQHAPPESDAHHFLGHARRALPGAWHPGSSRKSVGFHVRGSENRGTLFGGSFKGILFHSGDEGDEWGTPI